MGSVVAKRQLNTMSQANNANAPADFDAVDPRDGDDACVLPSDLSATPASGSIADMAARLEQLQNDMMSLRDQMVDAASGPSIDPSAAPMTPSALEEIEPPRVCDDEDPSTWDWDRRREALLAHLEREDLGEDLSADRVQQVESVIGIERDFDRPTRGDLNSWVGDLVTEVERLRELVHEQSGELEELRMLLSARDVDGDGDGETATGASAIAAILESDELVMAERQRLQALQDQWEEKFRRSEIEASIERAELSRTRREVVQLKAKLEVELEQYKREQRTEEELGPANSRRWLAKLGLRD